MMMRNRGDSIYHRYPTTTGGFDEIVNWALKQAECSPYFLTGPSLRVDEKA
jgi:hypothetical protein